MEKNIAQKKYLYVYTCKSLLSFSLKVDKHEWLYAGFEWQLEFL